MPRSVNASFAALAIVAASAVLSFRPIYEPDLWWHLAQGRENAAGRLVRENVFSFNYPDYRQRYTSWLFDTSAYLAWKAGGETAIQALQASLLALTLATLYLACRVRAPAWSAGAVLLIGFFILEPRAIPRPHLVSLAGMAVAVGLIERAVARRSTTPLWWSVPLVALWSNFHVECVFGVTLVAIFAAAELIRPSAFAGLTRRGRLRACGIAVLCGAATVANPYGWGLAAYLFENWSVPGILSIAELQPPPLPAYRAFYAYLAGCAVLFILRWRSVRLWEIASAVLFAALGARFLRLTPLLFLVTAPAVAARLAAAAPRRLPPGVPLLAAACVALTLSRVPVRLLVTELSAGTRAVAPDLFFSQPAIAFADRAGLEGPVFNSHNLGGYVAWMLHPRARIFQDSRLQAYPPEHFLSILVASQSQADWDVLVADVDWAVLSLPRPNQLSGVGRFPPARWAVVYRDRAIEIVVRRAGRYGKLREVG
jgi:hypothetical protein